MTESYLGADPEALEAYAGEARGLVALARPSIGPYRAAWAALVAAPASPPLGAPCGRATQVADAVRDLRITGDGVVGLAEALRALDTDGDGELDEIPSLDYLDLFLQLRDEHRPHDVVDWDWDPRRWKLVPETPEQRLAHLRDETDRLWTLADDLVDVNNDGTDGEPRQIRLDLNDPDILEGYSQEDLQQILELYRIDGKDGPLHFMVHGFTTPTDKLETAGDHLADLYDERGDDETTIVTIDWDSGTGVKWKTAVDNADDAAAGYTRILDALNASNPAADVKISAHSLGNKVALNALTDMADPDGLQVDYLAIQPAIPRYGYRENPEDFGVLLTDRIKELTVTINDGDNALSKYFDYDTYNALGEAEAGDDSIVDLQALRDELGLPTTVKDHGSQVGDWTNEGHLGLDPDMELNTDEDTRGDPLRDVFEDQVDR